MLRSSTLTCLLQVGIFPGLLARFVVSSTCPLNLLSTNVLSSLQVSRGECVSVHPLSFEDSSALCFLALLMAIEDHIATIPQLVLDRIPVHFWSTGPEDIGHLKVPPVMVTLKPGAFLPRMPQHPLKISQSATIIRKVAALVKNGALVPYKSPCNTPLFPVKTTTPKGEPDKYWMVQDLRAVSKATVLETPIVPNPPC